MTDVCTRKEGRSIQSYWRPGSMKGQRIHNAEASSQNPPIASWCESSALRLEKCESKCVCVCVYIWQRERKLSVASGICRDRCLKIPSLMWWESIHVFVTLSPKCQDSTPLWAQRGSITAKQIYCTDGTLDWETCGLPGITGLWEIYSFRLLSAKHACDIVDRKGVKGVWAMQCRLTRLRIIWFTLRIGKGATLKLPYYAQTTSLFLYYERICLSVDLLCTEYTALHRPIIFFHQSLN